jgi:DNA primase
MAIDFKSLRDISLLDVAIKLGLKLRREGETWRTKCPLCDRSQNRAFALTPLISRWYCHSCKSHGDALELVMRMQKTSKVKAAQWLQNNFGS